MRMKMATPSKEACTWDSWDDLHWHTIVGQLSGLDDQSQAAEDGRRELLKAVFMHELVNSNSAYQRQLRAEQDRQLEDTRILGMYQRVRQEGQTAWLKQWWNSWRTSIPCKETYLTLTYPEHSRLAWWLNMVVILAILWSTAMFCVETVPQVANSSDMDWILVTEYICLGLFTIEFLGRILTCPDLWGFVTSIMNIIDFLAIFPSYIEIILEYSSPGGGGGGAGQTKILRLIRLLRVLRLIRLWSRFEHMQVIMDAVVASADVLLMMFFLMLLILTCTSAVIYFIEMDTNPGLDSIPQAMYFIQTTLTTTGYGDVTPLTWPGRAMVGCLMLFAIVTLALPISVIGANFTNMWTDYKAMRDAASRSEHVWSNLVSLVAQVSQHKSILEEVTQNCQNVHKQLDASLERALECNREARLLYLLRATQGEQSAGAHEGLDRLNGLVAAFRQHVGEARRWAEWAEVSVELSLKTRPAEFVSKLDRMHMAYKNLRKWFEEGVVMAQEVQLLRDDLGVLRDAVHTPAATHTQ